MTFILEKRDRVVEFWQVEDEMLVKAEFQKFVEVLEVENEECIH
jgi:hypothetical protein